MADNTQKENKYESYGYWKSIIKASIKFRDKTIDKEQFKTYGNYFKGVFNKEKSQSTRVEVNMVFTNTMLMSSALASRDPWIALKARKEEVKSREQICESALNHTQTDIGFRHTLQDVIRDAQLYGYGVVKTGYNIGADVNEIKEEKKKGIVGKVMSDIGKVFDKVKKKEEPQPETPQFSIHVKKESAYCNYVDPKKFIIDPLAVQSINDAQFVIEMIPQRREYVAKKYGINEEDISSAIPTYLKDSFDDMNKETQSLFDMCVIYEIWDITHEKRRVLIEGYPEKMFSFDWEAYAYDDEYDVPEYPYEILIFNSAPGSPYGISDVSLYRGQQEDLNVTRSMEAESIKKNNPRWGFDKNKIDLKEVDKFRANETGTLIAMDGTPNTIVQALMPATTGRDIVQYESLIQNDIREVLGIADFMRGGTQAGQKGGKKSASQTYIENQFAQTRIGQRQNCVDELVLSCGKKIFRVMQKEYETPKYIKLVGKEGQYITKKNLAGEFDFMIQQGTGQANRPYMSQMFIQCSKFLLGNPLINPKEFTDIAIDIFLDGVDTSKLMIPNAEQISSDPIYQEQWRQIMLTVASQSMLQLASKTVQNSVSGQGNKNQIGGGQPKPGMPQAMPTNTPQPPAGAM